MSAVAVMRARNPPGSTQTRITSTPTRGAGTVSTPATMPGRRHPRVNRPSPETNKLRELPRRGDVELPAQQAVEEAVLAHGIGTVAFGEAHANDRAVRAFAERLVAHGGDPRLHRLGEVPARRQ